MKKISFVLLLFFFVKSGIAQSFYSQAIGIKFPGGLSATYKKFLTPANNIEVQATAYNKGFRVSGLYEFNFYSFSQVPSLSWFAGPGAHIGFWNPPDDKNYSSKADFGIDGIIGVDFKFDALPINVSLDFQPSFTLIGSSPNPVYGGVAVRYTF